MKNKIKTEWNYKLFYKNDKNPQIKKDLEDFTKAINSFEKKYSKNKSYLTDTNALLKACKDYEKLVAASGIGSRPLMYFFFRRDKNGSDKKVISEINRLSSIYTKLNNKVLFFTLDIGTIDEKMQKKILSNSKLKKFHYLLKVIFDKSKYQLSEKEEQVMSLMNYPATEMWRSGFSKVLNAQEVEFKKEKLPISKASNMISDLSKKDREILHNKILDKLVEHADFAEAELNALFYAKKTKDELRGYEKPYSQTVKNYQNEDETVENLVDVVTKNFKISHKFHKVKAKLLKQEKLGYQDRAAKIGELKKKFSFDETVNFLQNTFSNVDKKYLDIFNSYLENGQIDVLPKKGKKGGAYCWGNYGLPTFVLLNHVNNINSVTTLAHEMGHAFHAELSYTQSPIYADHTISVAEVASTFFENFVFEEIFETLSEKEKVVALHDKINDQIATIFRQIACFNFENEAHTTMREKGYVSKEELAKMMNKHMKSYLGPKFNFKDEDGYVFVSWPHIRRHFYVYSYAFGSIVSNALYAKYKEDKKFLSKVEEFLKAGASKSPEDIFGDIGVNIRNPKFFETGLKLIEEDIKKLEKLAK